MNEFIWQVRVYYEDTDAGGFVYHTNYLKFMERARTEWLRELGFEQTQLREQYNLVFVVRQISVDYLKPALFNELLQIRSHISKMGKASMTFTQQILRDTEILCQAVIKIAAINTIKQCPQPIPANIFQALDKMNYKL